MFAYLAEGFASTPASGATWAADAHPRRNTADLLQGVPFSHGREDSVNPQHVRFAVVPVMLVSLALALRASAAEYRLAGPGSRVIVWKSAEAWSEGTSLIGAKASPKAIMPLMSCAPVVGTKFVLGAGVEIFSFTTPVVIAEGPDAGCRGVIARDSYKKD